MMPEGSRGLAEAQATVLARLQAAILELRAVLDAERAALVRRDPLALDAATSAKTSLLQRVDALDAERRRLWGLGPVPQRDAAAWQELGRQLEACRNINEANGALVARQLAFVRRALDILNGAGEGPPALYDPSGHTRTQRFVRSFSQA